MSCAIRFIDSEVEAPVEATTTCDLCNTPIYQPTLFGNPILNPAIRQAYGSAAKVEVSLTVGENESDWGAGETISFDICPKCFEERLLTLLELQGAVPEVKEWSY